MRVLILAYSFYPSKSVAAIRTTYWAAQMVEHYGYAVDVITAEKSDQMEHKGYNHIYIPHVSTSSKWALIKDEGLSWKKDVLKYFEKEKGTELYDFVIISGGPFLHFDLGRKLKKRGIAKKAVLDYRDPFSYNPRFNDPLPKRWIKQGVELYLNFGADLILSVNDLCLTYIKNISGAKKRVIPNGYDERNFSINSSEIAGKEKTLVYPGKFYWHPKALFNVLKKQGYQLLHAGAQKTLDLNELSAQSFYQYKGVIGQQEIPAFITQGHIGVVFLSEIPFESTTKIFDYLGLNKKVLVITRGKKNDGVMGELLKAYPNVVWAYENEVDIQKALEELEELTIKPVNVSNYSRKHALFTLVEILEDEK